MYYVNTIFKISPGKNMQHLVFFPMKPYDQPEVAM